MKRLVFILPLVVLAGVIVAFAAGLRHDPSILPSQLLNRPLPVFARASVEPGQPGFGSAMLRGQPTLLNVWASWCAPCREEHALVQDIARRKLVPVYGLNYKDSRSSATQWLAEMGNPYQATLFDGDGRVGIDFGVYGVPETFIIDQQGIVRMKHVGPLTPEVIRGRIEPLLKQLNGAG